MNHELDFEYAGAYEKFIDDFWERKHRRYSLYGGRNSAKSTAAYQLIIELIMTTGNVICTRQCYNSILDSSYSHIKSIIEEYGIEEYFKFREKPAKITCTITGYSVVFKGLDKPSKVRSSKFPKGKVELLLFEEAQEIPNGRICEDIISTFNRGKNTTFRAMWLFNPPPQKNHFCNTELRESSDDDRLLALKVSYKDLPIEWVGADAIKDIQRLKETNYKMYLHEYMGEPIANEDAIFENVRFEKITDEQIDKWINDDEDLYCGLDFGYNPDPNAGVFCKYDRQYRRLYIFKEFYGKKLNNKQISDGLLAAGFDVDRILTCDNDEKTIADLRSFGWYRARAARKGQGSRDAGFKWLQGLTAIIFDQSRTPLAAAEFLEYHHAQDKYGDIKSVYPEGQPDHFIAGARYATEELRRQAGV